MRLWGYRFNFLMMSHVELFSGHIAVWRLTIRSDWWSCTSSPRPVSSLAGSWWRIKLIVCMILSELNYVQTGMSLINAWTLTTLIWGWFRHTQNNESGLDLLSVTRPQFSKLSLKLKSGRCTTAERWKWTWADQISVSWKTEKSIRLVQRRHYPISPRRSVKFPWGLHRSCTQKQAWATSVQKLCVRISLL